MSERVEVYLFESWVLEFYGCPVAEFFKARSHAVLVALEDVVVDFG